MLKGIRIIDFSKYLPGPYATMRLADKGAEVIVIEPLDGEPSRHLGLKKAGTGILYSANNRNKKSIAINLKEKEGQQLAFELIKHADIVVESFRPEVMKRLGLDYETVKEVNRKIIYCSISGYGQTGEMSSLGSHDLNYLALSGVLSQLKSKEEKPVVPSIQLADHLGAFQCTEEILTALVNRYKTNQGKYIDLALVDPLFSIIGTNYHYYQDAGEKNGVPELTGKFICYSIYQTKDNRFIALAALEEKFWIHFCRAIKKEEWISLHGHTEQTNPLLYEAIVHLFQEKTLAEWWEFSLKTDCCLTPILEINEIEQSPLLQDRQLIDSIEKRIATSFSEAKEVATLPPKLGEHTIAILTEVLGYSDEKVEELLENRIIGVNN